MSHEHLVIPVGENELDCLPCKKAEWAHQWIHLDRVCFPCHLHAGAPQGLSQNCSVFIHSLQKSTSLCSGQGRTHTSVTTAALAHVGHGHYMLGSDFKVCINNPESQNSTHSTHHSFIYLSMQAKTMQSEPRSKTISKEKWMLHSYSYGHQEKPISVDIPSC